MAAGASGLGGAATPHPTPVLSLPRGRYCVQDKWWTEERKAQLKLHNGSLIRIGQDVGRVRAQIR